MIVNEKWQEFSENERELAPAFFVSVEVKVSDEEKEVTKKMAVFRGNNCTVFYVYRNSSCLWKRK